MSCMIEFAPSYHKNKMYFSMDSSFKIKQRLLRLRVYKICSFFMFFSIRWISHIKDLLYKCCLYLEELKPESPLDMQSILIHLHTLVAFTATNTWALTRLKNFEKLRGGMTQLCANVMGSLFHKGYYLTLKVSIFVLSNCF